MAALLLAGLWCWWLLATRVDVYARATRARVELTAPPFVVATLETGRIAAVNCRLGETVEPGQMLIELESTLERAQLALEQRELAKARANADGYRAAIAAEERVSTARGQLDALASRLSRIARSRAQVVKDLQDQRAAVAQQLVEQAALSRIEGTRELAERSKHALELSHAELAVLSTGATHQLDEAAHVARISQLRRALVDVEGEEAVRAQAIDVLRLRIERRTIYAVEGGKVGSVAELQVGEVIHEGDVLATIVPAGGIRLVAEFAPEVAIARIASGQQARARFEGFSLFEYGFVPARVARVASDVFGACVRVELELMPGANSAIPLQHALPSSVDVLIERAAPWSLVLRSLGRGLIAQRSSSS